MNVTRHMIAEVLADFVNKCGRVDLRRGIEAKDLTSDATIFEDVLMQRGLALAVPHGKKPSPPARDIDAVAAKLDRVLDVVEGFEKRLDEMKARGGLVPVRPRSPHAEAV